MIVTTASQQLYAKTALRLSQTSHKHTGWYNHKSIRVELHRTAYKLWYNRCQPISSNPISLKWHPMAVSFEKFTEGLVTCLVLHFDCCQSLLMKTVFPPPPGWQSTCSQLHDAYSLSSSPSPLLLLFQLLCGDECACHCRKQAGHWCLWPLFLSNFCLGISSKSAPDVKVTELLLWW